MLHLLEPVYALYSHCWKVQIIIMITQNVIFNLTAMKHHELN